MKWRARFLLWLGKLMGVMTDAPEQPKEKTMEWSMDQVKVLVGDLTMNNYTLARENESLKALLNNREALEARLKELAEAPKLKEVAK